MAETRTLRPLEWGTAARSRPGEATAGDLAVVRLVPDGALVATVDGLGHGRYAAHAASVAGEIVQGFPGSDLVLLVRRCHDALRQTRGAVMSAALVSLTAGTLTWLGIGNVAGRLFRARAGIGGGAISLPFLRGVLGHELPAVRPATVNLRRGDVLVLATDGIADAFADSLPLSGHPKEIAERVLATHGKPTDDALVVAVRYRGTGS